MQQKLSAPTNQPAASVVLFVDPVGPWVLRCQARPGTPARSPSCRGRPRSVPRPPSPISPIPVAVTVGLGDPAPPAPVGDRPPGGDVGPGRGPGSRLAGLRFLGALPSVVVPFNRGVCHLFLGMGGPKGTYCHLIHLPRNVPRNPLWAIWGGGRSVSAQSQARC